MSTCQRPHTFRFVCACDTRPIVTSHIILCRCATHHITVFLSFAPSVHPTFCLTGYPYFSLRPFAYHLSILPSIHVSLCPCVFARQTGPLRSAPSSRVASRQSPHLQVPLRSSSASQSVRAYDHSSKRESTTFAPSLRVPSRQVPASSPSAPQLIRVPVRLCVRMTIRLSGSLQLSLRPCVRVSA